MLDLGRFQGVFPAMYACYDDNGDVDEQRTKALAHHLLTAGVQGLYITGSSGECVFLSVEERRKIMRWVMEAIGGKMTVIAHVGAASTRDSAGLAAWAKTCGVDAIASIPPFYFALPEKAVKAHWQAMIEASDLPFIIYNIPHATGFSVSRGLFGEMLRDPRVIGIKNTSMPVYEIAMFKAIGGDRCVVFNGPDEQFAAGRSMGADSGIGGTYSVMPRLFVTMDQMLRNGRHEQAFALQRQVTQVIMRMLGADGHLLNVAKRIMDLQGVPVGTARLPLTPLSADGEAEAASINQQIQSLLAQLD